MYLQQLIKHNDDATFLLGVIIFDAEVGISQQMQLREITLPYDQRF